MEVCFNSYQYILDLQLKFNKIFLPADLNYNLWYVSLLIYPLILHKHISTANIYIYLDNRLSNAKKKKKKIEKSHDQRYHHENIELHARNKWRNNRILPCGHLNGSVNPRFFQSRFHEVVKLSCRPSIRWRGCKFRIIELTEIPAPSRKLMRWTPSDTADTPMYELSRQQLS